MFLVTDPTPDGDVVNIPGKFCVACFLTFVYRDIV